MASQSFQPHTPSFGDEEFDITPMAVMSGEQHSLYAAPQDEVHVQNGNVLVYGKPAQPHPMYVHGTMTTDAAFDPVPAYVGQNYVPHNMMNQHHMAHPQQHHLPEQQPAQTALWPPSSSSPHGIINSPSGDSDDSEDNSSAQVVVAKLGAVSEPTNVTVKKAKLQKKKKKKDPNEPQKPVSAYALFFRDTQAAIKGQNPSASFGEVSKIVASMWDALDTDHKNVYKKKTELAKKDYLKALAAYRASLVSKGENDEGKGYSSFPGFSAAAYTAGTVTSSASPAHAAQTTAVSVNLTAPDLMNQNPIAGQNVTSPTNNQCYPSNNTPAYNQYIRVVPPKENTIQQIGRPVGAVMPIQHNVHSNAQPQPSQSPGGNGYSQCVRSGCPNPAVHNTEWEDEYCSNECVVSHCRDVFASWVTSN